MKILIGSNLIPVLIFHPPLALATLPPLSLAIGSQTFFFAIILLQLKLINIFPSADPAGQPLIRYSLAAESPLPLLLFLVAISGEDNPAVLVQRNEVTTIQRLITAKYVSTICDMQWF